jgi:hypothetical protein
LTRQENRSSYSWRDCSRLIKMLSLKVSEGREGTEQQGRSSSVRQGRS